MTIMQKKKIILSVYFVSVSFIIFLFVSVLLISATGCQNDSSENLVGNAAAENVSVGFYSETAAGDNSLVLTEAKFVLRKLVLKDFENHNDCDVKLGPFIVSLDMTQKVVLTGLAKIPSSTYDEVKFQVHKPGSNENIGDPEFIESTNSRFSVIAKGYFNGNYFVYKSDVTVAKEIGLEGGPVSVAANQVIYLTVRINPYSWFFENGVMLDPSLESNNHLIKQNIKNSLRRAFKDMDRNGEPD